MKILSKEIPIKIGADIYLNWHGYEDKTFRVLYVFGDTVVALDPAGKPININRSAIAEQYHTNDSGMHIVTPINKEFVVDDQIVMAGYFTGSCWLLSGKDSPISVVEFRNNYVSLEKFTTQNIMRVFDKMLVMLPMAGSGDEVAEPPPALEKPANCRNRLRDEGKAYPKSGCGHCKNGGLMGCPFEKDSAK